MSVKQSSGLIASLEFNQYHAVQQLKKLAQSPFDLTKEENLTPQRLEKMSMNAGPFKLLYGTERVTEEVMLTLAELAQEVKAVQKMGDMQSGKVMNSIEGFPSDNRPVLHTAMRDLFDDVKTPEGALAAVGLAKKEHQKLKAFLKRFENQFTDLVAIAIGGSDLGPRSVYTALKAFQKPGRNVHFIGNIDPDDTVQVLKGLDLKKTLVLVVSKSGTTLETVTNEAFARSYFVKAKLKPEEHFVAVTGEGSPMDDPKKYLECFYMWDFVGGRFSTSSMGGGVMLSFALGYDVFLEFLKGAHAMDQIALREDVFSNLPLMMALLGIWNRNFLNYPTVALIAYSQALARFPAHGQQVDMESNGKHIDRQGRQVDFQTGPIVWGEPGTCAQHSFYQLIHQGTSIIPLELIGFKKSQSEEDIEVQGTNSQEKLLANLFAQAIALAMGKKSENPNQEFKGNRPSLILLGEQLTPATMGALFALYEHKVVFQGFIWGINSFDQEGVQLGKVLAEKIIERFKGKGEAYPVGDALLAHLKTLDGKNHGW